MGGKHQWVHDHMYRYTDGIIIRVLTSEAKASGESQIKHTGKGHCASGHLWLDAA